MDRERFVKLMAMTTSENDGEALNALRMAGKMMATEKLTWEQVLAPGAQQTVVNISYRREPYTPASYKAEESWSPPHLSDKAVIEVMFRTIYTLPRGNEGYWEFIDSVHQWFKDKGSLTQAQYNAVRRAYTQAKRT